MTASSKFMVRAMAALGVLLASGVALAHGIAGDDQEFLLRATGAHIGPYIYLGAKHMVTGYDHLLFLAGVIFFLYRLISQNNLSSMIAPHTIIARVEKILIVEG